MSQRFATHHITMHDTYTRTFALNTLTSSLIRWAFTCLACLSMQLTIGITSAKAQSDSSGAGSLMLYQEGSSQEALLLDTSIHLNVQGLLAELILTQRFRNTLDQWVEGSYLYPMHKDAAIQGLSIETGGRYIEGTIKTREDATETYQAARQSGRVASLVEQQRPNLFTTRVSTIAPGDVVEVTLTVMVPVEIDGRYLQLTLPTTLTPRYLNERSTNAAALDAPFVTPRESRGPRLNLTANISPLDSYAFVTSQSHDIQWEESGISINEVPMDRDVSLRWPLPHSDKTRSYAFTERFDGKRYVQLLVNPPAMTDDQAQAERLTRRELIMVVDKSGSMAGVSMNAAKEALHYALDELEPDDYFNIIAFDSEEQILFNTSQPASAQWIEQARQFTNRLNADGGTEMDAALRLAMREPGDSERLRQIVFMTDGSVGYEDALLETIKQNLGRNRLFTVGIGQAPNSWFLDKAAEAGRGVSLTIRDEHDVAQSVTALLTALAHPVLTDIAVQYPNGHGELYPKPIPDLYADKPGMWIGRISNEVEQIIITGQQDGKRWRQVVKLTEQQTPAAIADDMHAPAVAMHWTQKKIESLLDEQRYSADADQHKEAITQLALSAGLVTQYTSFIAVERTPSQTTHPLPRLQQVANLLPAGNTMTFRMPQGAAGIDTLALLSAVLGLAGVSLCLSGFRARRGVRLQGMAK